MSALQQVSRKLYSGKGTLLGVISYPPGWDLHLERGGLKFRIYETSAKTLLMTADPSALAQTREGTMSEDPQHIGAVLLWGVTPEEFEQLPGCSFAPGAGYMRSLLEGREG